MSTLVKPNHCERKGVADIQGHIRHSDIDGEQGREKRYDDAVMSREFGSLESPSPQ